MKKVVIVRHGKKEGDLIAPDQLQEIRANGIKSLNHLLEPGQKIVLGLGSELERTKQTTEAFAIYMERKGFIPTKTLPAEKNFGNAALFNQLTGNAELMALVKTDGWYSALKTLSPAILVEIQSSQYLTLQKIFDDVLDNDLVIIVGHTPMIELLAFYIGGAGLDTKLVLKELQGVLFVQNEAGEICVSGTLG